jgi:CYTH domain-containing protein
MEHIMEIERKFTIKELPDLATFPAKKMVQAYLNTEPVIRIRREDTHYYLTYKGKGLLAREEYNLPLNQESFEHLLPKADGIVISKTRYCIPYDKYMIELDVFENDLAPLIIAEVEFESEKEAHAFIPPAWFLEDVTNDKRYHNSNMSKGITPII